MIEPSRSIIRSSSSCIDDLASVQVDDRLGVQHEAFLVECVPDRVPPS